MRLFKRTTIAIQAYIAKKGKKEAQKIFSKTDVSKLKAWGLKSLAAFVGTAVWVALDYSDVGTKIMKFLDSKDSKPNNGWVNIL